MKIKWLFILVFWFACAPLMQAQELFCTVTVDAPTVGSDRQVYDQMRDAITKYMNFQKWTDKKYEPFERIKCRMQIIISDRPSNEYFKGTIQCQVIRPVYNSTYETVIFNVQDKFFNVYFVPFTDLQFSDNSYIDNMTSILNFYAYMMIGVDCDSYELNGGSDYYQKARNVLNMAQNSQEVGWRNTDGSGNKNRYWLVDGFVNNTYRTIHNVYYAWHRSGLDMMEKDVAKGRLAILGVLKELQKLNVQNPNLYVVRSFLDAKGNEIVSVFQNAIMTDKRQVLAILENIDPGNMNQYNTILQEPK